MIIMAPKIKFTRKQMTEAALRVVQKGGAGALTAKSMAKELGTSTQPIFTCFGTMDSLKGEVISAAEEIFERYVKKGLSERIPFLGYGMQYIAFAADEPELYRLLFLSPDERSADPLSTVHRSMAEVRPSIMKIYGMTEAEADRYFSDMWLVAHSIATLTVTGRYPYSKAKIGEVLTGFSLSICRSIKDIPGFVSGKIDRDSEFEKLIK